MNYRYWHKSVFLAALTCSHADYNFMAKEKKFEKNSTQVFMLVNYIILERHRQREAGNKLGREGEKGKRETEKQGKRENRLENKDLLSLSFKEIMLHYLNGDQLNATLVQQQLLNF